MKHYLLLLIAAGLLAGCGEEKATTNADDKEIRAMMEEIRIKNLRREMLTEHDDSTMQIVIAHFRRCGTPNDLMWAYYLQGSVYRDLHDAPNAMEAFMKGIEVADTTFPECNYHVLTRLCAQKAELMDKQRLYEQSSKEKENEYIYAKMAADTLFMVDALWSKIGGYYIMHEYQRAADECWKVLEECKRLGKFTYAAGQLCSSVLANLEVGRITDARKLLEIYEQHSGDVEMPNYTSSFPIYYYVKGKLLTAESKLDSAELFFRREMKESDWNNRQAAYRGLRSVFEQAGRKDSALKYARLQCDAVDSAYQEMLSANLQNLHELYDYSRAQKDSYEKTIELEGRQRKLQATWMVMAIVTALLMLSGYYLYAQYKKKIAKAEAEMNQARVELQEMEERMELLKERISHAENEEERQHLSDEWEQARMGREEQMQVVADKEKQLANLRHKARKSQGETKQRYEHSTLFKYLHAKSKNNKVLLPEELQQVENMLLTDDAGLLRRLYNEAPDATETERMMFLLLRLGLSRADVSRLLAHDQSSLSSISNRMFRRVKGHGPMNSAEAYNWLLEI